MVDGRRKFDRSKYLAVFAITTLIFIGGILIGNYFAGQKLTQIDDLGRDFRTDTLAVEIQYDLIAEHPCDAVTETPLAEQLYELATKLDYMENSLGEDDEDVIALKEYYSLLELRHWMFNKKINNECGQSRALILYFYSNKEDCPECEQQGFILTWLRHNYPDDVLIYAFDYNIEDTALDTIKKIYDISETPSLVINDKSYNRFMTKIELADIIDAVIEMNKTETSIQEIEINDAGAVEENESGLEDTVEIE